MMNHDNFKLDFYNNYILNDTNTWHEDKYILYKYLYEMKNKLNITDQQQKIINFYSSCNNNNNHNNVNNNVKSKVFDVISNKKLCLGLYINHSNNITHVHDINQSINYEIINNNNNNDDIFIYGNFHMIHQSLYITLYDNNGYLSIFLCYPLKSSSAATTTLTTYTIHLITKFQLPQQNYQVKHIKMITTNDHDHDDEIYDNYHHHHHSIELWIVYDQYIYYYDGYLHHDQSSPSSSYSSDITLQLSFQLPYDKVKCVHFEV